MWSHIYVNIRLRSSAIRLHLQRKRDHFVRHGIHADKVAHCPEGWGLEGPPARVEVRQNFLGIFQNTGSQACVRSRADVVSALTTRIETRPEHLSDNLV